VAERVADGQVIGYVGSSGHSSGPHLQFEVHLRGDASPAGAADPSVWLLGLTFHTLRAAFPNVGASLRRLVDGGAASS
jgi:murein DD-endopeptidase MepM/ murein hydrolase activator NlpD